MTQNLDKKTVASFGDEWAKHDQSNLSPDESQKIFQDYFSIFPWDRIDSSSEGFDMGCGSGRWANHVATRVGRLHCIDPSAALEKAKELLCRHTNIEFHNASTADCPLAPNSQDFGYSLGVLHHIPDTQKAIEDCARLLKPGAPLLLYLYYRFDNRGALFRSAWMASNVVRLTICRMPLRMRGIVTDFIAAAVYWPLARLSLLANKLGISTRRVPLSYYRNHTFFTMRTDSRDRFGTPLEQRFTKKEIRAMLEAVGMEDIRFSDREPYWCAVAHKKNNLLGNPYNANIAQL